MKPCTCSDYQHVGCRGEAGLGEGWYCVDKHPNGPPPMTPPADPRTTLRALVEAGKAATPGEWRAAKWVNLDGDGGWAAIGPHHRGEDDDTDEPGSPSDELASLDASFIAAASAARPALSAIAGLVWLEPEVVRVLVDAASSFDKRLADDAPALARAEAELRAVEGR